MSNIPENEKLNTVENSSPQTQNDFSTIFSNPVEHKKSSEDFKKKKFLPKVIALFLVVLILAGSTFAVIKLIPEKEDETSSTPVMEEIEVLSLKSDELKSISILNNNGSFELYSEAEKSSTTSDSEGNTQTVNWYIKNYKKEILSTSSVGNIAFGVASISASREVTELTLANCGLDNPKIKATITSNDGKTTTVLLGNESPDKSGYYLKLKDSDKIYVVDSSLKDTLDFTPVSLADTNILPAFPLENISSTYKKDDGTLASFDSLTLSGKNFSEPLVINYVHNENLSEFATYKIVSPTRRVAENIDGIMQIFSSGVSVTGAYALDTSAKTLSNLGFDEPDFEAKMEIENQTHYFKFKLQSDGSYAAVSNDSLIVKKVDAETIPFADKQTSYFYSDWVALNFINDLKSFSFKVGEKSYDFDIKANPDTESNESFIINHNGKNIKSMDFQSFYEDCISLKCTEFTTDNVTGKPDYVITFNYTDKIGGSEVIEFTKFSETKYQYSVNGYPLGKVTISSLKALEDSLLEMIK